MCAIIKNPLQRDGTSQEDRLAKILLPGNARIDDRSIEEIMAFAARYAGLIRYYNSDNQPDGDWSCFYKNDPCILLALLATVDTDSIACSFKNWEEKIEDYFKNKANQPVDECEVDPLPGYYDALINLIFKIAERIQTSCKGLPEGHLLKEEIITLIKNDLRKAIFDNKQQDALIKLIGYDKASLEPVNDYTPFISTADNQHCSCTTAWQLDREKYDCIYPDNLFDLQKLKDLFYIFFAVLVRIKSRAKIYFEKCIEQNDAHQPHV